MGKQSITAATVMAVFLWPKSYHLRFLCFVFRGADFLLRFCLLRLLSIALFGGDLLFCCFVLSLLFSAFVVVYCSPNIQPIVVGPCAPNAVAFTLTRTCMCVHIFGQWFRINLYIIRLIREVFTSVCHSVKNFISQQPLAETRARHWQTRTV